MRADPIGLAGGINLYTYAQNNPGINIDPKGWESLTSPCKCNEYFHSGPYWGCVLNAIASKGTWITMGGWIGAAGAASIAFSPAAGTFVAVLGGIHVGAVIGSACYKYATFCDSKGPGEMPSFYQ